MDHQNAYQGEVDFWLKRNAGCKLRNATGESDDRKSGYSQDQLIWARFSTLPVLATHH